jgi:hypothetical protein
VKPPLADLDVNDCRRLAALDSRAFFQPLARVHQRFPVLAVVASFHAAQQQTLGSAAAGQPAPTQPRGKDPCVVDDEKITGTQEGREIRELVIGNRPGLAVNAKQPRRATGGGRLLSDQVFGEVE